MAAAANPPRKMYISLSVKISVTASVTTLFLVIPSFAENNAAFSLIFFNKKNTISPHTTETTAYTRLSSPDATGTTYGIPATPSTGVNTAYIPFFLEKRK